MPLYQIIGLAGGLPKIKPTMHQATSRSGVSVVLKIIDDSNECRLLQYLSDIKAPSYHTIPLLEAIDLSIGKTIIVLRWKSPLHEVLQFRDYPDDVTSLCFQFIEGVAFLHQHNVAHRDSNLETLSSIRSKGRQRRRDCSSSTLASHSLSRAGIQWRKIGVGRRNGPLQNLGQEMGRFSVSALQSNPGRSVGLWAYDPILCKVHAHLR